MKYKLALDRTEVEFKGKNCFEAAQNLRLSAIDYYNRRIKTNPGKQSEEYKKAKAFIALLTPKQILDCIL